MASATVTELVSIEHVSAILAGSAMIAGLQASVPANRTNVLPTAFAAVFSASATPGGPVWIVRRRSVRSIAPITALVSMANAFATKAGMVSVVQLTHIRSRFARLGGRVENVLSMEIALAEFAFAISAGVVRCATSPCVLDGQTNVLSAVNAKMELASATTAGLVQIATNQHAHQPFLASNVLAMGSVPTDSANALRHSPAMIVLQESVAATPCATTLTANAIQMEHVSVAKAGREQLARLESALDQMVLNVLDVEIA